MRIHLKQDRFLIFFFACLAFVVVTLLGCLVVLKHISYLQIESDDDRYDSYRIANELRRTSDDLTTMVRLYVVTGEKKYRDYFNEILSIRNGTSPRPEKYDNVYWDLVVDDKRPRPYEEPKSLVQMMIDLGFTLEEFQLLKEAEERSNALAAIEIRAMNAMEGKYDSGTGQYTIEGKPDQQLAIDLVFGKEYLIQKARIMFPIERFLEEVEERTLLRSEELDRYVTWLITIAVSLSALATAFMLISIFKALHVIARAAKENELLLLNILPSSIAERLKKGEEVIADEYPQASVLFSDLQGFTNLTAKIGTSKTVDILGQLFDAFDVLALKCGVEKIKTIGDSYMAVAGVPEPRADHAIRLADFALAMRDKLREFSKIHGIELQMRIGMTYGSVIAGVIGHKRFIYDVWGDVVNTASRMETTGIAGEIQITEKMALLLDEQFLVEERNEIEVKGKGLMKTFFLKGRKPSTASTSCPVAVPK